MNKKVTNTQKLVLTAILAALGMLLNLIEIPYPPAPWLTMDLSEIVILCAANVLGLIPALFVCFIRAMISILLKGPVGPLGIGQWTAFIASMSIATSYYYLKKILNFKKESINYMINIGITMFIFASLMVIVNYLFVTPTYIMQKPTWYTEVKDFLNLGAFNGQYGSNLSAPGFLRFISPYAQAILIIYFPFNLLKGLLCGIVYRFIIPVEKRFFKNNDKINKKVVSAK